MNTWFSFVARATTRQVSQSTTADDVNVSGGLSLRVDSGDVVRGQTWTCASASECSTARLGDGLASRSWVILARVPFDASSVGDVTFRRISSSHAMMFARVRSLRARRGRSSRRRAGRDRAHPRARRVGPDRIHGRRRRRVLRDARLRGRPLRVRVRPDRARDRRPGRLARLLHRRSRDPTPPRVGRPRRARPRCASRPLHRRRRRASSAILPSPRRGRGRGDGRLVGAWLVGGCAWVFSMVVLGGVTRLTRSGLSMTDWKFEWERPPTTPEHWEEEFAKYRASPEFRMANARMTVDEYKFIFWMEYGHRMWGRALGAYFALPLAAFAAKGWITRALAGRLFGFFGLGAARA